MKFRDRDPVRRLIPTRKPTKNWALHKDDLQTDFNRYCGYCHSYDGYKHTYFEVDHFVPKDLIRNNGWPIGLTQYTNLVYSCKFCNNSKLNNWPSNSATIYYRYNKGYIDPCDALFAQQFYRTNKGAIRGKTKLGKWMCKEAFKFDQREKGIKLLWNKNILRVVIYELGLRIQRCKYRSRNYMSIKSKLADLTYKYVQIDNELSDYYNQL